MNIIQLLACSAILAGVAVPASATVYSFELSGAKTASFTIDNMTTPDFLSSSFIGDQVSYNGVAGSFGGTDQTASIGFGTFLAASFQISGTSLGFTQYAGPDLFALIGNVPVFNTGTFNLSSITSGPAQLSISQGAASAVPEPATWAMLIVGSGAIGFSMRQKRKAAAAVAR